MPPCPDHRAALLYLRAPLAASALERLPSGAERLLWLADRVAGWGRVYVVEALCRLVDGHPDVRPWLLRRAIDGGFLNGYFAGKVPEPQVSTEQDLSGPAVDTEIVDHAGRLHHVLICCQGMGTTLARYAHAEDVLAAHLRHLQQLGPSSGRYYIAA